MKVITFRDKYYNVNQLAKGDWVVLFAENDNDECDIIEYTHKDDETQIYYGKNLTYDGGVDHFDEGNILYIIKETEMKLHKDFYTVSEVAQKLGKSRGSIWYQINRLHMTPDKTGNTCLLSVVELEKITKAFKVFTDERGGLK